MNLLTQTREQLSARSKSRFFVNCAVTLLLLAAAFASSVRAQSITLAWDPVSGVSGYKVYQGGASRVYTNSVDAGAATQRTMSGLTPGRTYYLAVTAYNSSGVESDYSSEISYTVPANPPTITLTSPAGGASYSAPATIHLAANVVTNGHTVNKVQFFNNGGLAAEVTAAPFATDLSNVNAGVYSFTAKLVYDGTLEMYSAAVNGVTVTAGRPPPVYPLSFTADSGTITAPFALVGGILSQNLLTSLLGSGEAVYNFTIDWPGNYVVSAMVNAPSANQDAVYINVDGEPTDPLMIWDMPITSGFTNQTATWRGNGSANSPQFSPKVFTLSAGTHQLYVRGKEPNTQLQSFVVSPANALMHLTRLAGRMMNLTGLGKAGHVYEVQTSQNLKNWTVLGNVTADSTGAFNYTDTSAPSFSNRCYRLRDTTP